MTSARLAFVLILCGMSSLWAALALLGHSVRFEHRDLVTAIRAGGEIPKQRMLDEAIGDYEQVMRNVPCNVALHEEIALLLGYDADRALVSPDIAKGDAALERIQSAVAAHLACTPMDGKAWLDFAVLTAQREGFTKRSLEAYKMSAQVAPGESWLAQKRLLFALEFRPLLDAQAIAIANRDLAVLDRAHPNRMTAVVKAQGLKSGDELRVLFASTTQ